MGNQLVAPRPSAPNPNDRTQVYRPDTRSNINKFGGLLKGFGEAVVSPVNIITRNLAAGMGANNALEQEMRRAAELEAQNARTFRKLKAEKKITPEQYRFSTQRGNELTREARQNVTDVANTTSNRRLIAAGGETIFDLATLGTGKLALTSAKTGLKGLARTGAKQGAVAGAFGSFSGEKAPTAKEVAGYTAGGAALGGVLPIVGRAIGKILPGATSRKIAKSTDIVEITEELYKKYPNADPDELVRLAESLTKKTKAKQVRQIVKEFEVMKTPTTTPNRVAGSQFTKGVVNYNTAAQELKVAGFAPQEVSDILADTSQKTVVGKAGVRSEDVWENARRYEEQRLAETSQPTPAEAATPPTVVTPEPKPVATQQPAPVQEGTPSASADLAQADITKIPDDIQQKIINGQALTPEDMSKIAEVSGATPARVTPDSRIVQLDRTVQEALKRGGFDEAVAVYMKQGMSYGDAQAAARRVANESDIPLVKQAIEGEPRTVDGKAIKAPEVKQTMKDLSAARAISNTDAKLSSATIERAAKQYGVDTSDLGFIQRYQSGQLTDPNEVAFGQVLKQETDRIFELQKQIDPTIEYRQNYLPQSYAQDATKVDEAVRLLQTRTNAASPRKFRTYEEAQQFGLAPKFQNIEQMVGESAGSAQNALANKAIVDNGLEQGLFSTRQVDRNWKIVEGFSQGGSPIYASPKVANVINNALQESTDALSKSVRGLGKLNATWQDIMLSGGVPYTPANFFVFGQMVKEFTAGRVGVVKDLIYSMSDNLTQKRFVENADFVRKMADRGLTFNVKTHMDNVAEGWLDNQWGKAMNKATFERFMPNQYLSVAENIYKKTGDLDLAANTVKQYYGIVDQIAKGRSTNIQNGINAAFFAPKYRESIINSLINTGKSLTTGIGDPSLHMNRRLAAGMAVTVVAAEMLQRQISGHGLLENRKGQEASIEITLGEKDEKGNQKVVNIPLMPGFLTLPRAAIRAVQGAVNGDIVGSDPNKPSVLGEASKVLATPLQVAGQALNNADYFGRPIYNSEDIANQEGTEPDSGLTKFGKIAKYVGFQGMPGYGRAVRDAINGKSGLEVAAQAGELPLRFGKRLNPATESYFKDRDEIYSKLDKNGKAVWDAIHPKVKNVNGEYMTDPTVDSALARAANYLNNDNVRKAENEMARRAKARGQKVDPLWELDDKKQRIALRIQTLPPMDPQRDKLKKDNPWYTKLSRDRSAFFDSLPPSDPNKPKSPVDYPEPDAKTSSLVDAYYQLEDSAMKRNFLKENPEVGAQFAKQEQYNRAIRAAKDLPQYDKYPEASPEVQRLNDLYSNLPKGEGKVKRDGTRSSPTRSAWIKSHPKEFALLTDHWNKTSQWTLQNEAEMANFEGEEMSEKGIKAISSIGGGSGGGGFGFSKTARKAGEWWVDEKGEYHRIDNTKKRMGLEELLSSIKASGFKVPDFDITPQKRVFKVDLPSAAPKKSKVKIRL